MTEEVRAHSIASRICVFVCSVYFRIAVVWLLCNLTVWFVIDGWPLAKRKWNEHKARQLAKPYDLQYLDVPFGSEGTAFFRIPYLLYVPEQSNPTSGRAQLPVVIVLHGSDRRGSDGISPLKTIGTFLVDAESQTQHNCVVIAHNALSVPLGLHRHQSTLASSCLS